MASLHNLIVAKWLVQSAELAQWLTKLEWCRYIFSSCQKAAARISILNDAKCLQPRPNPPDQGQNFGHKANIEILVTMQRKNFWPCLIYW